MLFPDDDEGKGKPSFKLLQMAHGKLHASLSFLRFSFPRSVLTHHFAPQHGAPNKPPQPQPAAQPADPSSRHPSTVTETETARARRKRQKGRRRRRMRRWMSGMRRGRRMMGKRETRCQRAMHHLVESTLCESVLLFTGFACRVSLWLHSRRNHRRGEVDSRSTQPPLADTCASPTTRSAPLNLKSVNTGSVVMNYCARGVSLRQK